MRKKPMPKKSPPFMSIGTVIVLLLVLWLSGCATPPAPLPPLPVKSVQIPALPSYARQPAPPPECLPTCESGLTKERESWLNLLQTLIWPAEPASVSTTAPAQP